MSGSALAVTASRVNAIEARPWAGLKLLFLITELRTMADLSDFQQYYRLADILIEQANKEYGTQLLVSEHAYDEIRQQARVGREFADTAMKGKSGKYKLYEIVGLNA